MSSPSISSIPDADAFLTMDQAVFGNAWRYELIGGEILADAAPSPVHARILAGLMRGLGNRLSGGKTGCVPEAGSGGVPEREPRDTARIPDAMIRCGDLPRVTFEVISPSELKDWRGRDKKRRDIQAVAGVAEIVEIYQNRLAIHVYRKGADGSWVFQSEGGADASLPLFGMGEKLVIPLAEIYEFAMPIGKDEIDDAG